MKVRKRVMGALFALAVTGGGATYLSYESAQRIAQHEGYRMVAYPDPGTGGAPWTICRGHTRGVVKGMRATPEQCDRWYAEDLRVAERGVQKLVRVPLKQGEYDSLVSFVFNAGEHNLRTSTLLRKLNAGDRVGSCNEYLRWVYANKMVLNGLKTRRTDERRDCLKGGRYVFYPS
jgi:lysozyme